jgi:hypothetical protein
MSKIDIIYRCCEAEVKPPFKPIRPDWFDKIKCFDSFYDSCANGFDYIESVTFLHDGPKGEISKILDNQLKFVFGDKANVIYVDYCSNEKSLLKTFDIADEILKNKVYFVEDDYLHLPNSVEIICKAVDEMGLVNGYDHLDRYIRTDDWSFNQESIIFSPSTNRHWRTAESTCCTWAATKDVWNFIKNDCRNFKLQDRELFRNLMKRGLRLYTPIPGITTQVDDKLSPGVDWKNL